jgi:hypothetical protein
MDAPTIAANFVRYSTVKTSYVISAITILFYDYALTLPLEVDRFWNRKRLSWVSALFYVNRYTSLLAHIPVIAEYFWGSYEGLDDRLHICYAFQTYHRYYVMAAQVIIAGLLIARTYALYGQNKWILSLVVAAAAGAMGLGCWAISSSGPPASPMTEYWPPIGCIQTLTDQEAIHLAIAWGGLIAFDMLIYLLTLYKAFGQGMQSGKSVLHIILRDASIYIAVILVANVSNVLTLVIATAGLKGIGATFSNVMASVMVSRLLFNLRDPSLLIITDGDMMTKVVPKSTMQFGLRAEVTSNSTATGSGSQPTVSGQSSGSSPQVPV